MAPLPALDDRPEAPADEVRPRPPRGRRRSWRVAGSLSLVRGLGQLYNLQPLKALFFLLSTTLTIGPAVLLIMAGDHLGPELLRRHDGGAFLLLAFGSIMVFLALFILGLAFWASAAVDARRSAEELSAGRAATGRGGVFRLGCRRSPPFRPRGGGTSA